MPPDSQNHYSWTPSWFEIETSSPDRGRSFSQMYADTMFWTPTEAYQLAENNQHTTVGSPANETVNQPTESQPSMEEFLLGVKM
jgi:hypothetical protein